MHGIFAQSDSNKLSILNGSHSSIAHEHDEETVLVFPDFAMVAGVGQDESSVRKLYQRVLHPDISSDVPW